MKRIFFLLSLLINVTGALMAQQFPVQVTPQLLPPYSTQVSEYYSAAGNPKLSLLLLNRDFNKPTLTVRLRMSIEGQGFRLKTREDGDYNFITIEAGVPKYLDPVDFTKYFSLGNVDISGMSPQEFEQVGKLPEGFYTFCFEAVEETTGQTVSNKGCTFAWMNLNEPPMLNLPRKGESIDTSATTATQNIVFNWTPRHTASPAAAFTTEYIFSIVEITDNYTSPEAAFVNGSPLDTATVTTTTFLYDGQKHALIPGNKYAWRVQAKTKNDMTEVANFKNNGFSEVFWFTYKNTCPIVTGIADSVKGYRAVINWLGSPLHLDYKLIYREVGNAKAEWFTLTNTATQIAIGDLKPQTTYEYRVGCACEQDVYNFSATRNFTTKDSTSTEVPNCGDASGLVTPKPDALKNLMSPGDTIKAGDFKVIVTKLSSQGPNFSGEGYVPVSYLANMKLAVVFTGITVDTLKRLQSGQIQTTYDPTEGGIESVDDYIDYYTAGYGVGSVVTGVTKADTTFNFTINSITASLPPAYDSTTGTVTGGGTIPITITPTTGNNVIYSITKLPVTIADKDGTIYQVDKHGVVTKIASAGGAQWIKTITRQQIDDNKARVDFVEYNDPKVQYAFDEWKQVYTKSNTFNKEYERLHTVKNEDYYVSAKAIAPGATDYIKALVRVTNNSIIKDSIKFVSGTGNIYTSTKLTDSTYEIAIVGGPEKDAQEIYAVYPRDTAKTLNFGKLLVASYPRIDKKLVVIPVNGTPINVDSISAVVNRIYNKINIYYTVTPELPYTNMAWDEDGNGLLEVSDDKALSILTSEMKLLNNFYKKDLVADPNTQYLFAIKYNTVTAFAKNLLGDMPRGKQFGYLFTNDPSIPDRDSKMGYVAAHELGHGAFTLKHIIDYGDFTEGKADMDNLMDYPAGNSLSKFQWNNIHDPAITFGFLQDEDEGAYVQKVVDSNRIKFVTVGAITNFLTPTGNLLGLPANSEVYVYCMEYDIDNGPAIGVPNGVLYGFKTPDGKEYSPSIDHIANKFNGYFEIVEKNGRRQWKDVDLNKNPKYKFNNATSQSNNANAIVTFIHFTKNPCTGAHEIWFMDQNYNFTPTALNATDFYYPSYQTTIQPSGENIVEVALDGCKNCVTNSPSTPKVAKGVRTKIDEIYFKYTEYKGVGETIQIDPNEKKILQDFLKSIGDQFKKKIDVFIYPENGSKEAQADADYNTSKLAGNKAIKIQVGSDGTVKVGKENGVAERGVFNFDLWGFGVGNECATAYVDKKLQENGSDNKVSRFCQRIYYGIKGVLICSIGEDAWLNLQGRDNFTGFVYGFTYEFLETLDVVQLSKGLYDLGVTVVKYSVWEAPKMWTNQIYNIGKFFLEKRNQPISLQDALTLFVPGQMIEGVNKAKSMSKSLYAYYADNGNSWRYGQLTMIVVPLVLTLGEYSAVIATRLSTVMPRLASSLQTVERISELSNNLNRLTNLGFELALKAGTKVLVPLKLTNLGGGAIKNVNNTAEALVEVAGDVEPILDDAADVAKIEDFIDDAEELGRRSALLNQADNGIVNTALNNIPNDGKLYIAVHGEGEKFFAVVNRTTNTTVEMNHRALATWIKKNYGEANEIVLLSCGDLSSAQNLVNKLGAGKSVTTWEGAVDIFENGRISGAGDCRKLTPGGVANADGTFGAKVLDADIPKGKVGEPLSGGKVTLGGRKGRIGNFATKLREERLLAIRDAWNAVYPKIFIERGMLEDILREYRYLTDLGWQHTLDFADNFKAIDFFKTETVIVDGAQDIIATQVVSVKTTTTMDVFAWLRQDAVKKNIFNLKQGATVPINWVRKKIIYGPNVIPEVHIYMPKANLTLEVQKAWYLELNKTSGIKFEIHVIEDFMTN